MVKKHKHSDVMPSGPKMSPKKASGHGYSGISQPQQHPADAMSGTMPPCAGPTGTAPVGGGTPSGGGTPTP